MQKVKGSFHSNQTVHPKTLPFTLLYDTIEVGMDRSLCSVDAYRHRHDRARPRQTSRAAARAEEVGRCFCLKVVR